MSSLPLLVGADPSLVDLKQQHSSLQTRQGPSSDDWSQHKETVERLYLDEGRPLKDVMSIMALQFGHCGTVKMYKSRITKWGFDKNKKAQDVAFILRKKVERDAVDKNSTFRIRGRRVSIEEILRYANRKAARDEDIQVLPTDGPTPPHISCYTPAASPAEEINARHEIPKVQEYQDPSAPDYLDARPTACIEPSKYKRILHSTQPHQQQLVFNAHTSSIRQFSKRRYSRTHFTPLPAVITPPQVFLWPEQLFASITSYFVGSFLNGGWKTKDHISLAGKLYHPSMSSTAIADFENYFHIGSGLVEKQEYDMGRRVLGKAFNLIPTILAIGALDSVQVVLNVIINLKRRGRAAIATMLQTYVGDMARTVLKKGHPLQQIFLQVSLPEIEDEELMVQCSHCIVDVKGRLFGLKNEITIVSRTALLCMICGSDLARQERLLQSMLRECEQAKDVERETCLPILKSIAINLVNQRKFSLCEAVAEDLLEKAQACGDRYFQSRALPLRATAQYWQLKDSIAEENMRAFVDFNTTLYGRENPMTIHGMEQLAGWLRRWNRLTEAERLETEISELLGPDDTDV